ncbi:uncharacterized protein C4orf17 homolog [Pogona vitticeps]|nr:uncharacterized protein C4orf17 homolog isoform X1 [Pogona vitticeps]XP_020671298.1 uncharacterized protein C4orf17 homolog isoform X1 [Pogona vitticeps]XP_020671299.1 uncharacterized protein C4orf17 homolog isoform X1 [Pogona vitticeps]
MNINFKAQPEPQLTPYGKTTYFACRHTPHPKTVCHMKGLNDTPVCVVKDRGYNEGHFIIPGPDHGQFYRNAGTAADNSLPRTTLPNLVQIQRREDVTDHARDEIVDLTKRAGNTPLLKRKDDPLRKYLGDRPHSRTAPDHRLSSGQAMRYRPEITENFNYTPSYLEHEIKILEKLRDILQTDSLAEIQEWLGKATLQEKEFVSNFIRADITSRELLNYQQKPQKENEAERLNLQSMLKNQQAVQQGTADDTNQVRTPSQIPATNKGSKQDKDRGRLLSRTGKIRIPTSDHLPLEHSTSRSTVHGSQAYSPASSQNSTQLLYSKSRSKRSQRTSREYTHV